MDVVEEALQEESSGADERDQQVVKKNLFFKIFKYLKT